MVKEPVRFGRGVKVCRVIRVCRCYVWERGYGPICCRCVAEASCLGQGGGGCGQAMLSADPSSPPHAPRQPVNSSGSGVDVGGGREMGVVRSKCLLVVRVSLVC